MLPAEPGIGRTLPPVATAILHAPALARRIAPLTVGHASVDFTQGALPVLLPYLHREFGLSYLQDGILFLALTVSSSVTQPLFGHLSDRRSHRLLLPGAIMLAGLGLAGCALAPNYGLSLLAIFLAGLGVAAYHPEASRLASVLSGDQRGTGMSLFSVGGNLGFALGAAGGGLIAAGFGLDGGWLLVIPGLIGATLIYVRLPDAPAPVRAPGAVVDRSGDDRRSLYLLLGGLCLRGYVNFGMLAFIPLYEERVRGRSDGYGAILLGILLFCGAMMTLVAGPLADRIGPRRTMVLLTAPVGPLTLLYVLDDSILGAIAVIAAGALVIGTFSVSIVLSQIYLRSAPALAAGLSIGLSIGIGGAFTVVIGGIGDAVGLDVALATVSAVAVVAVGILLMLPRDRTTADSFS
jgi:FSR family fosmidomycin resistance protein-like MFS transporter